MKIEVKEIKPTPPPREFVVTYSEREFAFIAYLVGKSTGYDTDAFQLSGVSLWQTHVYALGSQYELSDDIKKNALTFTK
jgi:hypothetical protein